MIIVFHKCTITTIYVCYPALVGMAGAAGVGVEARRDGWRPLAPRQLGGSWDSLLLSCHTVLSSRYGTGRARLTIIVITRRGAWCEWVRWIRVHDEGCLQSTLK